jgi:hypothetical protein
MKNLFFSILLIFFAVTSKAQVVSGLYSGTLYNDTTKMLQNYQLALSEYKGKITGYSYTTFVVNDTFYYGIRKIKAFIKDEQLIVEDDKMMVNNFPESPSKGVKRISIIPINPQEDTLSSLSGKWQTNKTKQYYAVSGPLKLKRDNDSSQSALIGNLKELSIIGTIYQLVTHETSNKTAEIKIKTKEKKQEIKTETQKEKMNAVVVTPTLLPYEQRKDRVLKTIETTSDSLILSFYDNGVVDGDMISVYVNGQNVVSNARLTEVALKKTVNLKGMNDLIEIKLVAENLGSLPPNTGLLIVQDGIDKHIVNFSADLQTNATILFRKRK